MNESPLMPEVEQQTTQPPQTAPEPKIEAVPDRYIPVNFCTLGKLSAPETLHFRNYTLEEASELSAMREEDYLSKLIVILNRMVWEDFDCANLHEEELKEIMLNLRYNFWGKTLENLPYYIDETLRGDAKEAKDNIGFASVPIEDIARRVQNVSDEFSEPIGVTTPEGAIARFRLPRITDELMALQFVNDKYKEQERKYANVKLKMRMTRRSEAEDVKNPEQFLEYLDLLEAKEQEFYKVRALQRLLSVDGKEYSTISEKMQAAQDVDLTVWNDLYRVDRSLSFGVSSEVSFYEETSGKTITRRFEFRPLDFIPDMESPDDSRNVVSFGT